MNSPEFRTKPKKLNQFIAGAAVGVMAMTGCQQSGKTTEKTTTVAPTTEATPSDPIKAALDSFRDDFYQKRRAKVMMGFCMGWQNLAGKITVTSNPGLISWKDNGEDFTAPVFSFGDRSKAEGDVTLLNGPENYEAMITLMYPTDEIKSRKLERVISDELKQEHGQIYHTDIDSGQPVIDTVITEGPLTNERVGVVCNALRSGQVIAGADQVA